MTKPLEPALGRKEFTLSCKTYGTVQVHRLHISLGTWFTVSTHVREWSRTDWEAAAEYDTRQRTRILRGLRKRATSLGFELVEASTGLVV